jgi:2-polyprenyl-3-methyl-5-hydroxy-6-metoxy-1,4-benzoquinol methylase
MRIRGRASRRNAAPAGVDAADAGLVGTLEALDGALNYRGWILDLADPYLTGLQSILEVGAGHGTFTSELARKAHVTALELGVAALDRLRRRFRSDASVTVSSRSLDELGPDEFDAAFLSNVLEHIEDDVTALRQLARTVRPGGHVIVFSPAFMLLYSDYDASIGHHHRYRLPEIRRRFVAAGLEVRDARYVNSVGFFSWLLLVRLLKVTPETLGAVGLFDRWFVPWLRRIERVARFPFGQSVFIAGRVPVTD